MVDTDSVEVTSLGARDAGVSAAAACRVSRGSGRDVDVNGTTTGPSDGWVMNEDATSGKLEALMVDDPALTAVYTGSDVIVTKRDTMTA